LLLILYSGTQLSFIETEIEESAVRADLSVLFPEVTGTFKIRIRYEMTLSSSKSVGGRADMENVTRRAEVEWSSFTDASCTTDAFEGMILIASWWSRSLEQLDPSFIKPTDMKRLN